MKLTSRTVRRYKTLKWSLEALGTFENTHLKNLDKRQKQFVTMQRKSNLQQKQEK